MSKLKSRYIAFGTGTDQTNSQNIPANFTPTHYTPVEVGTEGAAQISAHLKGIDSALSSGSNYTYSQLVYVDPVGGNDTTGNGNYNAPYATITQAISVANTTAGPVAIKLVPGTYTEDLSITVGNLLIDAPTGMDSGTILTGTVSCNIDATLEGIVTGVNFNNVQFNGAVSLDVNADYEQAIPAYGFTNCDFSNGPSLTVGPNGIWIQLFNCYAGFAVCDASALVLANGCSISTAEGGGWIAYNTYISSANSSAQITTLNSTVRTADATCSVIGSELMDNGYTSSSNQILPGETVASFQVEGSGPHTLVLPKSSNTMRNLLYVKRTDTVTAESASLVLNAGDTGGGHAIDGLTSLPLASLQSYILYNDSNNWLVLSTSGGGGGSATGIQGTTGIGGVTGIQGTTGLVSGTGVQGATGVTGATGIQGFTGSVGVTGVAGTNGVQGITGIQGQTGIGVTGIQGATGVLGITGIQGQTGVAGATGIQGSTGIQGATGIQGQTGVVGATGIQGITGLRGMTGIEGTTGVQGQTGIGITGVQGVAGATGVGATGAAGVAGAQGSTGVGSAGVTGASGGTTLAVVNAAAINQAGQTLGATSQTILTGWTTTYDTGGSVGITKFTVKTAGKYRIHLFVDITGSATYTASAQIQTYITQTGSNPQSTLLGIFQLQVATSESLQPAVDGSITLLLAVSDTFYFLVGNGSTSATSLGVQTRYEVELVG